MKYNKTCPNGHRYFKSSDCPVCPVCETENKPEPGFLSLLSAPARRALENASILSLTDLAKHTRAEILKLHGMGPASIPVLTRSLQSAGLDFKQ